MFNFSFSSVSMCVVTSNIFLIMIYLILGKQKLISEIGYKIIGYFLLFAILRFCFPFELPVTTNIYFPEFISMIIANFQCPCIPLFGAKISVWNIVEVIWFGGIAIFLFRYLKRRHVFLRFLKENAQSTPELRRYEKLAAQICTDLHKKQNFKIIGLSGAKSPMVCFWKKPCIIMPLSLNFTDSELTLMLEHEIQHIFHHDLLLKSGICLLNIIYWWNPFGHFLKKQCDLILEMRADKNIVGADSQLTAAYLDCLLKTSKLLNSWSPKQETAIPFCSRNSSELTTRFRALTDVKEKKA